MMCYRDMTFCGGGVPRCAKFETCHRALTQDVAAAAARAGKLVSRFAEPERQPCYVAPEKKEDTP